MMKKIYFSLLLLFTITNVFSQLEGTTWRLAPTAGALAVGPTEGDFSWWSNSEADVAIRACLFDDKYVFNADGSFENVQDGETWVEGWQMGPDTCSAPVAPHNDSNAATWFYDVETGTITIAGLGAYLGLSKVHNGGELSSPAGAVDTIVYPVVIDSTTMTIDIPFGTTGYWHFVLEKEIPEPSPLAGTMWKLAPMAQALGVGPNLGDFGWWSNSMEDVAIRACLFDDKYVFNADGSFENVQDGATWVEGWQGGPDTCSAPVAPHDGSNAASWYHDQEAGTVTIIGLGAYLGLAKVYNGGELSDPMNAVDTIVYPVVLDSSTMTIDIYFGAGYWHYVLEECVEPEPMPSPLAGTMWKLAPMAQALGVGPNLGDFGWWSNSMEDVAIRACLFDDKYVFNADGSFENVQDGATWVEGWQGGPDTCSTPVAPHDGSNAASWYHDQEAETVTIIGLGAYLGLAKVYNGGELSDPMNAVDTIVYPVVLDNGIMTIDIYFGAGYWHYVLEECVEPEPEPSPLSGTMWKLAPMAQALAVGPAQGDFSWWSNSMEDVAIRACLFDDKYVFNADGSFENIQDGATWVEGWQGGPDTCSTPVAPHDGSNAASWYHDQEAGTVTIIGLGAYLGLAKVYNGGELSDPMNAVDTIVYPVVLDNGIMTIDIYFGAGYWHYVLEECVDEPETGPSPLLGTTWTLAPMAQALAVGPAKGDFSWWSNGEADVAERHCLFDDKFVFNADGTFENVQDGATWLEGWQAGNGCGTPVAPHDGSNAATWYHDQEAGTLMLVGFGAHLGLPKVINGGELENPADAPDTIIYEMVVDSSTMTIDIDFGAGYWHFVFEEYIAPSPLTGTTWTLAPMAGALGVGPSLGDVSWWSNGEADVAERHCLFDDKFVFNADGTFSNVQDGATWLEGWQGTMDACGTPVAPHDGSNAATWSHDEVAETLQLDGLGAHLGLAKVINGDELSNPADAPDSITYIVTALSDSMMTVDIAVSGAHWRFILEKYTAPEPLPTSNVTFAVDMNDYASPFTTVYVSGTFNNWSGTANPLTDADGDGVWTGTIPLEHDTIEYKFTLDDLNVQEDLQAGEDDDCTITTGEFTNRSLIVSRPADVCYAWETCNACTCAYLVWSDEFDGNALDPHKWETQIGRGSGGWGNQELQYYRAENATVGDGKLTITAKNESFEGADYTSSRLRTKDQGDWKYGRFEASIKLPTGQGIWPAFWMLPTDEVYGGWPRSGEIDIMELVGHQPNVVHGTLHYGPAWPNNKSTGASYHLDSGIFNDDFHVFAIEWEENVIRWYVDDVLYSTKTASDLSPDEWRFDQDFHFLLNVAVGGNWPGSPDGTTMFPQTMEVDYVRVYKGTFSSISGNQEVAFEAAGETYTVENAKAGATYTWAVPSGATIASGQGTSSIIVDWGGPESSGAVVVTIDDGCSESNIQLEVTVTEEMVMILENTLENFDEAATITFKSSTGTLTEDVNNPETNGVNSSALVGQYCRSASAEYDDLSYATAPFEDANLFVDGTQKFFIDVYTDAPVGTEILLQLENDALSDPSNYPSGRHSRHSVRTTVQNAWERLAFDYIDQPSEVADNSVDNLVFLFNPNSTTDHCYYFDNFEIFCVSKERCVVEDLCPEDLVLDESGIDGSIYRAAKISSAGRIKSGADVTFAASTSVTLRPGFHTKTGAIFTAKIEACPETFQEETTEELARIATPINTSQATGKLDISVFPNPMENQLTVQLKAFEEGQLRLFDGTGKTHISRIVTGTTTLNVNDLPAGIYFLQVWDKTSGETFTRKVVRQQ